MMVVTKTNDFSLVVGDLLEPDIMLVFLHFLLNVQLVILVYSTYSTM